LSNYVMTNHDYWHKYYADNKQQKPSKFAKWVKPRLGDGKVIDIGCGDGRDTEYLGAEGWDPHAPEGESFVRGTWRNMLRRYPHSGDMTLYARWFFHAITEVEEEELLRRWKGELFIEGRVDEVENSDHYRRPHDVAKLLENLRWYGYEVLYDKLSDKYSPQGEDKPILLRVHATRWT